MEMEMERGDRDRDWQGGETIERCWREEMYDGD